jgi:hypothetical protein
MFLQMRQMLVQLLLMFLQFLYPLSQFLPFQLQIVVNFSTLLSFLFGLPVDAVRTCPPYFVFLVLLDQPNAFQHISDIVYSTLLD